MKKLLLVLIAVMGLTFAANAQNNAIGLRLGGSYDSNVYTPGTELSFQTALGANRLEADLGYHFGKGYSFIGLAVIYQLHFDIAAVPNLGWYAGLGGRVDLWTGNTSSVALGAVGQLGLDYQFQAVPLQLSLDVRPALYFLPDIHFSPADLALGIRYTF